MPRAVQRPMLEPSGDTSIDVFRARKIIVRGSVGATAGRPLERKWTTWRPGGSENVRDNCAPSGGTSMRSFNRPPSMATTVGGLAAMSVVLSEMVRGISDTFSRDSSQDPAHQRQVRPGKVSIWKKPVDHRIVTGPNGGSMLI